MGTDLVKTAKFDGNEMLDGTERRPVEGVPVAGGVNLADGAVQGKEVNVGKGFDSKTSLPSGIETDVNMFAYF